MRFRLLGWLKRKPKPIAGPDAVMREHQKRAMERLVKDAKAAIEHRGPPKESGRPN